MSKVNYEEYNIYNTYCDGDINHVSSAKEGYRDKENRRIYHVCSR